MANSVQSIMTQGGRQALAQSFGGPSGGFAFSYGKYFKIGTAGFQSSPGGNVPQNPSDAYTDIQSVVSGSFYYRQTFYAADILFVSPFTIQFRCLLNATSANGNPLIEPDTPANVDGPKNSSSLSGQPPVFFEIGVYDENNVMVAYGTFPGETKLSTKTLNHLVNFNF
jgi:hypothetical protein